MSPPTAEASGAPAMGTGGRVGLEALRGGTFDAPARVTSDAGSVAPVDGRIAALLSALGDYAELGKARVAVMVLLTTLIGFLMALGSPPTDSLLLLLLATLVGTGFVALGAASFNQILERSRDAVMRRTRERPLPAGRMELGAAVAFATVCVLSGLLVLASKASALSALLALVTCASYVLVYTPLKTRSHLSTVVGAVPGALPPLIGWAAVEGTLSGPAWILFGLLFFWQLPHFLAIAWLYREDYARGGYPVLTVVDPSGRAMARQSVSNTLALILTSLLPFVVRLSGPTYAVIAIVAGGVFLAAVAWLAWRRTRAAARAVLWVSLLYLPCVFVAMVWDRMPGLVALP